MSDWERIYKERLTSKEEAIGRIPRNGSVWLHHAVMEPQTLVREITAQRKRFDRLRVYHMVRSGAIDITTPGYENYFIDNPIFAGANSRAALAEGKSDYTPCFFYELPYLLRNGRIPCEAALLQVSAPDRHGYCSLGASVDYAMQAARTAPLVIAQVNNHAPRTLGDCFLHVSEFGAIVEADEDIYTITPPSIGDEEKQIGANCASLIEDGCTLQLGIGGIPDAVML
ncbi:MAG: 4-hydroxybutyrate CoA-transferase, partial [Clostridiales bacterium]|nr:4-hydroxybutyrate CoA-transferase [Clostridiales bacterium]